MPMAITRYPQSIAGRITPDGRETPGQAVIGTDIGAGRDEGPPIRSPNRQHLGMPKPIASTRVEVTRPDKLLWPQPGITKQAYVDYLAGVDGERYFQKNTPKYAPSWVRTVTIPAPSAGRDVAYTVCNDADTLVWLGNQAALELHPAPVRRDLLHKPDLFVVDID